MSMDHEKAKEQFSDFWEQTLDEAGKKEVEEHLRECAPCKAEYEQFQQAMQPLTKLHKVPAPDLIEAVPALIHKRSAGRFFGPRGWLRSFPFEWVSLAMLALVGAVYALLKLLR